MAERCDRLSGGGRHRHPAGRAAAAEKLARDRGAAGATVGGRRGWVAIEIRKAASRDHRPYFASTALSEHPDADRKYDVCELLDLLMDYQMVQSIGQIFIDRRLLDTPHRT